MLMAPAQRLAGIGTTATPERTGPDQIGPFMTENRRGPLVLF